MTIFDPGSVVLVRFPFTNLSSDKKRPAVVVSPATYSTAFGDIVVLALTSQPLGSDDLLLKHWSEAGLPKPTWVRPVIATLSSGIVNKRLGAITDADRTVVSAAMRMLVDGRFGAVG